MFSFSGGGNGGERGGLTASLFQNGGERGIVADGHGNHHSFGNKKQAFYFAHFIRLREPILLKQNGSHP